MPATFLSGVFYSIHTLPAFWQGVSHWNPIFYTIDGFPLRLLRGVRRLAVAQPGGGGGVFLALSIYALRLWPAATNSGTEVHASHSAQVRQYIADGLPCDHLDVQGDGSHFDAVIVSAAFEGKRLIQRHQLVYAALGDRMKAEIHALSMRTLTLDEYRQAGK